MQLKELQMLDPCFLKSVTFCHFLLLQSLEQYVQIYNPISLLKILFCLLLDAAEGPHFLSLYTFSDPEAYCLLLQQTPQRLQNDLA